MATITAAMVKELRELTGVGMMDCKNALAESDGDVAAAVDWLRTKGLAKASKKAGRVAAEGLVGISISDGAGAIVEVNSETDFVARNATFQEMVASIAGQALGCGGDLEKLSSSEFPGAGKSVSDYVTGMIASIGENMTVRRVAVLEVGTGVVAGYIHNQIAPGLGKIGVLVALESDGDREKLAQFGRQVAMHVAATSPLALDVGDLDPAVVERERHVLVEQARDSGKPEEIIAKMVEGRLRKYYQEVVLLAQTFVIDGENTVEKALKAAADDIGAAVAITGFVRFQLGEGIEKQDGDFAAEVAAAVGGA